MRIVYGLDVHKDSVFVCILSENGDKIEAGYGVLMPELEALRRLPRAHGETDGKETLPASLTGVVTKTNTDLIPQREKRRKNAMKVKVAMARKMLNAVCHVLDEGVAYRDYKWPVAEALGDS